MRIFILCIIKFYQKNISPKKGFRCAYGVLHQNGTCSSKVSEIIKESPINGMYYQISNQFKECASAKKTIDRMRLEGKDEGEDEIRKWCMAFECGSYACCSIIST